MKLKATKTKMLALVRGYTIVPREVKPKDMRLRKTPGRQDYIMEWRGPRGDKGMARLHIIDSEPWLTIHVGLIGEPYPDGEDHRVDIGELAGLGLVEEERPA